MNIVEKAKKEFNLVVSEFGSDPYFLQSHLIEMERWAYFAFKKYPDLDKEVVLLSVWLHDIGHYPIPTEVDHAVRGVSRAQKFFERENFPRDRMEKVLHCIRSHRCNDVEPESLEAKLVACIDSASHITDTVYFRIAMDDKKNGGKFRSYGKMERDFRDLGSFPEIKNELRNLYYSWEKVVREYERINM